MAVRPSTVSSIVYSVRHQPAQSPPTSQTAIFQGTVNKCQSFYRGRSKGNTSTHSRPLSFSPHFFFTLCKLLVILVPQTLPVASHALLFWTGQDLDANFSALSQLRGRSGRSFREVRTSLNAKQCVWREERSWLEVSWLHIWHKKIANCGTTHKFKAQEYKPSL